MNGLLAVNLLVLIAAAFAAPPIVDSYGGGKKKDCYKVYFLHHLQVYNQNHPESYRSFVKFREAVASAFVTIICCDIRCRAKVLT